jgi:hypothetical protein
MIDPTIWEDENFGTLSSDAKLMFIGLFSNADDEGRIRANPAYLKSTIFIYNDMDLGQITTIRSEVLSRINNVKYYIVDGKEYIQLTKWHDYQKQHKDRIQSSTLPRYKKDVADNVGQMTDNVGVDKVRLVKVKLDKVSVTPATKITDQDLQEISDKYKIPLNVVQLAKEEMFNWLSAKGKRYKDYKAGLRNWVLRDAKKIMEGRANAKSRVSIDVTKL